MKYALILFSLLAFSLSISAQDYQLNQSESSMKVSGTSTLHDWDINVESFNAKAKLNGENLESASFTAEVKSMKSGTSSMDDNTYKAMKESDHPRISFKSNAITGTEGKLTIKGDLTIAGVTKPVTITTTLEKWAEKSMTVKGNYTFKMSEFGIDPPRAMLGTIRTGDEVTITFKLVLYK